MRDFVFQSPWALALLGALLPLAWVLARARAKRTAVVQLLGGQRTSHPAMRDGLRLAALALAIVALARPGVDPQVVALEQAGRDVVVAVDVSRSMLAEDVAPSRLEAAKQAVRDVLVTLHGQRMGLVVYAGSASILCPLTDDYDFVRYMLDQANPDTVDFGGTQWQSAIDKITGQVFDAERRGFADLVLLTDGDDQGEGQERVAEALRKAGAGLLLVGLGGAGQEAKIPIVDDAGKRSWLEAEGAVVHTRMNREALTALAASVDGARFFEAGTAPFDLGAVFHDYVASRPTGAPAGGTTHTVYREWAFWMMPFAGLLLALAQGWPLRWRLATVVPVALVVLTVLPLSARADAVSWRATVAVALAHQEAGRLDQAIEVWNRLDESSSSASAAEQAVVALDRGLALVARATQQVETVPSNAWSDACRARDSFLAACRLDPTLVRAGWRLDATARLLADIQLRMDADAKKKAAEQSAIAALVERLKSLLKAQDALSVRVPSLGKKRKNPAAVPTPSPELGPELVEAQASLNTVAASIQHDMAEIDRLMSPLGQPEMPSILKMPLVLMGQGIAAQARASEALVDSTQWTRAHQEQSAACGHFRAILDLLANNKPANSSQAEKPENKDDAAKPDDDSGEVEASDADQGQNANLSAAGDLSQTSDMQPLPTPNYSVQDILREEAANQQFRQQKRASAQAGKVKKDW